MARAKRRAGYLVPELTSCPLPISSDFHRLPDILPVMITRIIREMGVVHAPYNGTQVINAPRNPILKWLAVAAVSLLILLALFACKKAPTIESLPIKVGNSYQALLPQLGWSETGKVNEQVINAKSIVLEGRLLERTDYTNPPLNIDGKRELTVIFSDEMWSVTIWARNKSYREKEYYAESVFIALNQHSGTGILNSDKPPINLPLGVVVGRSSFKALPDINLGKPLLRQRILNSAFWYTNIGGEPRAVRFNFDSGDTLVEVGFSSFSDQK